MTNFVPIDIECTTRCPPELGFPGSPFYKDNELLLYGHGGVTDTVVNPIYTFDNPFCFHNGSFDMHWMRRWMPEGMWADWQNRAIIWDTQIAAHILSSGRLKFSSLDGLSAYYDVGFGKMPLVSKAIKEGMIEIGRAHV
jgi:hypothetical protein